MSTRKTSKIDLLKAFRSPKYDPIRELGRGGMGWVILAEQKDLRRPVAVKVNFDTDPSALERFGREALLTARVEHPNIVPVHEVGQDLNGRAFLVMKVVKGSTLTEKIRNGLNIEEILTIFPQICRAITHAHHQGVIHRDLKPDNILVGDDGVVQVMDWGLAKFINEPESIRPVPDTGFPPDATQTHLTQEGMAIGTPIYMPPEQAVGLVNDLNTRSDIYSLGAVLYEMLTGKPPVSGISCNDVLIKVAQGKIIPIESHRRPIPPELASMVKKAMSLKPRDRYQTVEALSRDLERYGNNLTVEAHKYSGGQRIYKWMKKNSRKLQAATAITAATLFVSLLFLGYSKKQDRDKLQIANAMLDAEAQARKASDQLKIEAEKREATERNQRIRLEKRARAFRFFLEAQDLINRSAGLDKASELLNKAIDQDPDFFEAYFARAQSWQKQAEAEKAIQDYQRAYDLAKNQGVPLPQALLYQGDCCFYLLGDNARANRFFERASELDANNSYVKIGKAYVFIQTSKFKEAEDQLDSALIQAPYLWELHFLKATIIHQRLMKDLKIDTVEADKALKLYQKALSLNEKAAYVYNGLGLLLKQQANDFDRSYKCFTKVIELMPNWAQGYNHRAVLLYEAKKYDDALIDANQAVKLGAGKGVNFDTRAMINAGLAQYEAALVDYDQGAKLGFWVSLVRKGELLHKLGRYQESTEVLEQALIKNPKHATFINELLDWNARRQRKP